MSRRENVKFYWADRAPTFPKQHETGISGNVVVVPVSRRLTACHSGTRCPSSSQRAVFTSG
jgi:hypothetical protein